MAKINTMWAVLLFQPLLACAATPAVPDDGLRAEGEKRWDDAVRIYRSAIAAAPGRSDLWFRIADIEAARGNAAAAAEATRQAVQLSPRDPPLQYRLAQAYAVAKQPEQALGAIDAALAVAPTNMEYLRARTIYANWLGRGDVVEDCYTRMMAISKDDSLLLSRARARSLGGRLDKAAADYRAYVQRHPEDEAALMESIKLESWRGNLAEASRLLDQYRQRFGETVVYRQQRARVYAMTGHPSLALPLTEALVKEDPANYDSRAAHTLALSAAGRPRETLDSLEVLKGINPAVTAVDTEEIRRFVTTSLRHEVSGGADYYRESDGVRIYRYSLLEEYQLRPETRLLAGQELFDLTADRGSGLENADGGARAQYRHGWVGVRSRLSPDVDGELLLGASEADGDHTTATYRLRIGYRPVDNLKLSLESGYDYFTVSPRTVSLGIRRQANTLRAVWSPDLNYTVDAQASADWLSDGNSRWEFLLAPRRSVLRSQYLNMDVGPAFSWQGFSEDPGHGYYSPSLYQRYAMNAYTLWKINENNSVGLTLSAGVQRDEDNSFEFGVSSDIEALLGIYRDWMLRLRVSLLQNGSGAAGGYDAQLFQVQLSRRF